MAHTKLICDPGWSLFNGTQMCYKTVINRLSFDDAEKSCQSNGGHLVSIHSEAENEFVVDIAGCGVLTNNEQLTDIYIGLYREVSDPVGKLHWTDGTPVDYTTWTNNSGFNYSEKLWIALAADPVAGQNIYKKFRPWYPTALPTARGFVYIPTPICPLGSTPSTHDPTFCYFVLKEINTFENAEYTCQAYLAHLPKINDLFTNYYIGELARSNGFGDIWIGATNTLTYAGETCNNWYWTSGKGFLSFNDWAPSEPSSGNCAMLSVKDGYYWHSQNCNTFLPTICQLPAVYSICDPDWNYFNVTQMCYKTFINSLSASDSEAYCQARRAHLVSIHSEEENEFIVNISASGVVASFSISAL
ncbi:hypothetical protein FO519_010174, partial [Halicephalobus sp. NKZ332]